MCDKLEKVEIHHLFKFDSSHYLVLRGF